MARIWKGVRAFIGQLAAAFALSGGFTLLVLGFAAWASAFSPRADGLTGATSMALGGCVACLVLWLLSGGPRSRGTLVVVVLAALAHAGLMAPAVVRALGDRPAAGEGEMLRIVQFNTYERNAEWTQQRLDWLASVDADVLAFQEVDQSDVALIPALRGAYPYAVTCESAPHPCSVWLLSKRAPLRGGHFSGGLEWQANTAWIELAGAGGPYAVAATHLDRPRPDGRQSRQLRRLADQMKGFDRASTVLAGDFNAVSWSFELGQFGRETGLERRTHLSPSWPTRPFAFLPIDHVFAGSAWRTVKVERGPYLGSDHHPVVVTLRRP